MHLATDALIHHLPITQDPAMGCRAIIVFYRFRPWSDAWISRANTQIQWVYLYKYFNKTTPPPPLSIAELLIAQICKLMQTHINAHVQKWLASVEPKRKITPA